MKKIILFGIIMIGLPYLALRCMGHGNAAGPAVQIAQAYAYPSIGTAAIGAAFMEITNSGTAEEAILSAASPVAGRVELHDHLHENGVMRMRAVNEIPVPAGETVRLKSGGLHVMLFELKQPLKLGDQFPITLQMKSGGSITTQVKVEDRE